MDWKDLSASDITKRVTGKVQSGSICLFHNAALHTPEALPSILEYFKNNGYTVVSFISQNQFSGKLKRLQQFLCHADIIAIATGE